MKRIVFLTLFLGVSFSFLADAGNKPLAVNLLEDTERSDARLNGVYNVVMKKLSPEISSKLRGSQRLWIKYRDSVCDFEGIYFHEEEEKNWLKNEYSTGNPKILICIKRLTEQRTQELELYLHKKSVGSNKKKGSLEYEYYSTGELEYTHTIKNGARNGVTVGYYKDGVVRGKWYYVDNKKHGTAIVYHKNGAISRTTNFVNGKRAGE